MKYSVLSEEYEKLLPEISNKIKSISEAMTYLRNNVKSISDVKVQREAIVSELKSFSEQSQKDILSLLKVCEVNGDVKDVKTHWLSNLVTCTTTKDYIYLLSEHNDVEILGYNELQYLLWELIHSLRQFQ